ncbi:MAG: type II toxin-antitoxin system VapC family toxin [Deltaproteobacteria bacterium]|nr:type II toxin-antitoxin system VapC family toxin [Deltaproteobacteria bacterium]
MILVDTSIWVAHLRQGSRQLEKLLMDAEVMCHPFIIGELACGNLQNRNEIISLLQSLPITLTIEFDEFLFFMDRNQLMGKGVAFVDVHLLASAQLTGVPLWTADKRLKSAADQLELSFNPIVG